MIGIQFLPDSRTVLCGIQVCLTIFGSWGTWATAADGPTEHVITGAVQNQDLRRVPQAVVQVRDQEGTVVATGVTNDGGEFSITVPTDGTFSVSAVQETYRSEYVVIKLGKSRPAPVMLTLALTQEIALEVVSPLAPINTKASSETYSVSRKEIEVLPRGNNLELQDVLQTIPSAAYGGLKQVHIRQDHANLQFRIDGVPIPDTVSSTFSDVISPRAWERADILLGGLEAQYGNKSAGIIDITSKSGTRPPFGSLQAFGGSNQTFNPSFEYGGTVGETFRYYALHSFTTTNRGIEPQTLKEALHAQSERHQTFLRGDYQHDNRNNFTWLFLNATAKYQIPTTNTLMANAQITGLIGAPTAASQDLNEFQKENNQYAHMVWRHDVTADQFFSLAGYFRHTRATFVTDPLNALRYTPDENEPFSAGSQYRNAYSAGLRLDYTYIPNKRHLVKTGLQVDRTQAVNKTRLFAFAQDLADADGDGETRDPIGGVLGRDSDNRLIGWREELWLQDQWTPDQQWTFNLGLRYDQIQYFSSEGQLSPRLGITYKPDRGNAFHFFYGRLFTPPNLEAVSFAKLNVTGTTAEPENQTNNRVRAERAHYVQAGSQHALFDDRVTVELTGFYKLNRFMSDAGQFGTTPLLNFFAFERGWQRGLDLAVKAQVTDDLAFRGSAAWGQCKGYGLQSGHFLLEQAEINDINSKGGVFCDHSQFLTSSAVLSYRLGERTTVSGQMLYGSGLRTAETGGKTNSTHEDSYTTYNLSVAHVFPLEHRQKFLLGFDVINLLNEKYFYNRGEGSIGLGVAHAGMPQSFFVRGQWFF
jgi:outer membrane receptor protein involved in Fe transport